MAKTKSKAPKKATSKKADKPSLTSGNLDAGSSLYQATANTLFECAENAAKESGVPLAK